MTLPTTIRILLCVLVAVVSLASEPSLKFKFDLADVTGDAPMIVLWVEKTDGTFVRTLQMFSKDKKYYPDITVWDTARTGKEKQSDFDAVVGATIHWGQSRELIVPIKTGSTNLLAGDLVLRIEQRKDKGGHYKKCKIPLTANWSGITLEKEGYIKQLTITVTR